MIVQTSFDLGRRFGFWLLPLAALVAILAWRTEIVSPVLAQTKTKIDPKDGLTYVLIPSGTFQMGCSPSDPECHRDVKYPHVDESPTHAVTITKDFWIGQTPVTQAAYTKVVGNNPSFFKGNQRPVEGVSWDDAQAYCGRVGMRLPTEAEYEYAARGRNPNASYAPLDRVAWYDENSGGTTHDVAQKQANDYGLYDMLGNVWEWVADWHGPYSAASAIDPQGPKQATPICFLAILDCHEDRIARGGSWRIASFFARASSRGAGEPTFHGDNTQGFRCAGN